jgi:transposase InsO family protein
MSIWFSERLAQAGNQPSVGAVGSSYDNALAEAINGLYKTELIKPCKPWRSVEDVEVATAANTGPLDLDSETFGPAYLRFLPCDRWFTSPRSARCRLVDREICCRTMRLLVHLHQLA